MLFAHFLTLEIVPQLITQFLIDGNCWPFNVPTFGNYPIIFGWGFHGTNVHL